MLMYTDTCTCVFGFVRVCVYMYVHTPSIPQVREGLRTKEGIIRKAKVVVAVAPPPPPSAEQGACEYTEKYVRLLAHVWMYVRMYRVRVCTRAPWWG